MASESRRLECKPQTIAKSGFMKNFSGKSGIVANKMFGRQASRTELPPTSDKKSKRSIAT